MSPLASWGHGPLVPLKSASVRVFCLGTCAATTPTSKLLLNSLHARRGGWNADLPATARRCVVRADDPATTTEDAAARRGGASTSGSSSTPRERNLGDNACPVSSISVFEYLLNNV